MARLLDTKFNCSEEFRDALRQTGSRRLVHPVPDSFWGYGPDGRGRDMFSQLLMELRRNKLQTNRNPNQNSTRPTTPPPPPPPAHDPITKSPVASTSTALQSLQPMTPNKRRRSTHESSPTYAQIAKKTRTSTNTPSSPTLIPNNKSHPE